MFRFPNRLKIFVVKAKLHYPTIIMIMGIFACMYISMCTYAHIHASL